LIYAEIAKALVISEKTVSSHLFKLLRNPYARLGRAFPAGKPRNAVRSPHRVLASVIDPQALARYPQ